MRQLQCLRCNRVFVCERKCRYSSFDDTPLGYCYCSDCIVDYVNDNNGLLQWTSYWKFLFRCSNVSVEQQEELRRLHVLYMLMSNR